jgi:hypothetical protein
MDNFQSRSGQFLQWFKQQAGATFHNDIEIVDLRDRNAGRGIVATRDIAADTVLFTIPRDAILTVQTSNLVRELPDVFDHAEEADPNEEENGVAPNEPLDSWASLILVLIYEYLLPESRWKPYFEVLPDDFDTLMFWSDEELGELQTSSVVGKIGRHGADEMFRSRIIPVIRKHPKSFPAAISLTDDALMQIAHRMGSTIMAYAFDLENEDEDDADEDDGWVEDKEGRTLLGMVPMADTLNADAEFNVRTFLSTRHAAMLIVQ